MSTISTSGVEAAAIASACRAVWARTTLKPRGDRMDSSDRADHSWSLTRRATGGRNGVVEAVMDGERERARSRESMRDALDRGDHMQDSCGVRRNAQRYARLPLNASDAGGVSRTMPRPRHIGDGGPRRAGGRGRCDGGHTRAHFVTGLCGGLGWRMWLIPGKLVGGAPHTSGAPVGCPILAFEQLSIFQRCRVLPGCTRD